jgi:hypothetical protein
MPDIHKDLEQTMQELRPRAVREMVQYAKEAERPLPEGVSYDDVEKAALEVVERSQLIFWDRLRLACGSHAGSQDLRTITMLLAMQMIKMEFEAVLRAFLETVPPEKLLEELMKMGGR